MSEADRWLRPTRLIQSWTRDVTLSRVGTDATQFRDVFGPFRAGLQNDRLAWTKDGRAILFATADPTAEARHWQIKRVSAEGCHAREFGAGRQGSSRRILTSLCADIMMSAMRTTLTLDRDVAERVTREMRRTGKGLKATINDALRRGLNIGGRVPRSPRFEVQPHAFGVRPGIDLDRMNQLVDELDVEDALRKLRS